MSKILLDSFPIVLFFIAYKSYDLFIATIVIVVASLVQVITLKALKYKIEFMHLFSLFLVVLLGSITLLTKSASFIMYKVTILNLIFAILLIFSQLFMKQNFVEMLLAKKVQLKKKVWRTLNQMWIGFFVTTALINYFFADKAIKAKNALLNLNSSIDELAINLLNCSLLDSNLVSACQVAQLSEEYWVNFKFYGILGLVIGFIIIQSVWLAKKVN